MNPIISIVIPTRNRPSLVTRAVQSALEQTFKDIEVIVVIDGPDKATRLELIKINDPRLKVIELPTNIGGSGARNTGVNEAKGEWIAFLDDDDEWMPQKLELQIEVAQGSQYASPIIACCVIIRTPKGEFIRPKRLLLASEPLCEYLLARKSFFQGKGLIQTSVLLTKKDLLLQVPFRSDLRRHQDWDWRLRVSTIEGIGIEFVPKPLAIWYIDERHRSTSNTSDWQYSLSWVQENRNLLTPRAYSAFIMLEVALQASKEREWSVFWTLLWEAIKLGKPQPIDFLLYFWIWLLPQKVRSSIKTLLIKKRNGENSCFSHSNGSRENATV